jgi:protein tyrosine/serine phosphatase
VIEHDARFIELAGAHNFRDLGGLPTREGATTRTGVLYRSDALHHLQSSGVQRLGELGVRTIVDLRSSAELEHTGRGPLETSAIAFVHAPLSHSQGGVHVLPPSLVDGDLGGHYVASLAERTETLVEVISLLATAEHLPAVFHCAAGKDRTGLVAALVLSLVGVADDVIVEDYALTDDRMVFVMEAIRASDGVTQLPPEIAARVGRAEAESMETFLQALAEGYGSAEGWARAAGMDDDTLTSLRTAIVTED